MTTNRSLTPETTIGGLLLAGLLAAPALVQAQPTAHYVPGVEGIKAASLPPPGVYLRDYNVFYYANTINDDHGKSIPGVDPRAYIYANVPRLIWITDQQLLGGFIGVDGLLPLQYTELKVNTPGPAFSHNTFHDQTFGIGDFFAEVTWSRHIPQFDISAGCGVFAPTGDFSPSNPTQPGLGYWGEMLTAGATWYPDAEKQWAISALNRYEFNQQQRDTDITPGQAYTLEWGISRTFVRTLDVGVIGYYQQQVTGDSGPGASSNLDRVAGVGPEVSYFYPPATVGVSLRYNYEFFSENRLQGHTFAVTITKRF
jgi:hypothetical protein